MPSTETAIEWTDATWNPLHGCAKVSEGCANCYAARMSHEQYGHTPKTWTQANAAVNITLQDHHLDFPTTLDEPSRVFVNSMSDLFLPEQYVPDDYLHRIFDVIDAHPEHAFIALTKHGAEAGGWHEETPRLQAWNREYGRWPANLWMGVSVESDRRAYRADILAGIDAQTKWISFEPLVAPIDDPVAVLEGIDWVVVGGESGPADKRREMDHAWARQIRDATTAHAAPFYFKQSSGARQGYEPVLAQVGRTPAEGRLQAGRDGVAEYKQLPRLPDALREARPDLAEWEAPRVEEAGRDA